MNGKRQPPAHRLGAAVLSEAEGLLTDRHSPITAFLIDTAAIRNPRNSLKTNNGDQL